MFTYTAQITFELEEQDDSLLVDAHAQSMAEMLANILRLQGIRVLTADDDLICESSSPEV